MNTSDLKMRPVPVRRFCGLQCGFMILVRPATAKEPSPSSLTLVLEVCKCHSLFIQETVERESISGVFILSLFRCDLYLICSHSLSRCLSLSLSQEYLSSSFSHKITLDTSHTHRQANVQSQSSFSSWK